MIFLYSYVSRFWLCSNLCVQQRITKTQLWFLLERRGKNPAKLMQNVFCISSLWKAEAWGLILSCYQERWLHSLQLNSQLSQGCRPGRELCSPCLSFQTAFEALNKSKSSSHTALLPAFLGAPFLVQAVQRTNREGQRKEFLFKSW